jgi:CubicO group peptidase (beta-lactamase class C family)
MNTIRTFFAVIAVICLAGCTQPGGFSLDSRIQRVERGLIATYNDPFWKRMDLLDRMAYHHVPGVSIAVVNNNQLEWAKGYGVLQAGDSKIVTTTTLFQPGSVAKAVVAVAALQAVDAGVLDLDQDVNRYLLSWHIPENEFTANEKVTLRRLLSHSAGVTVAGFRGYAPGEPIPGLLQILDGEYPANSAPIQVDLTPGIQERYSGGGYMIVQQLLEDVTGQPFAEFLRLSLLDPWGMPASTFESPLPEHFRQAAASGHRTDGSPIPGGWYTYPELGSGAGMWSTAGDLAQFLVHLMHAYNGESDQVLSHAAAVEMMTPQIDQRGLGPQVYDGGSDLFYIYQPGANDGFKSILVAYPLKGQAVIILTNGDNGDALWRELLNSVSIEYGWVKDYTGLYIGITSVVVLSLVWYLIHRLSRTRRRARVH